MSQEAGAARPPREESRRWRLDRRDLVFFAGYLAAAVVVLGHLWINVNHRVLSHNPGDHTFFEWVLAHGATVLTHGENPLFSYAMNAPNGVNLMANTSILGLSLPLAPVTVIFGPAVAFAVVATIALGGTAMAWYYVLSRTLVASRVAAAVGGLLAGFAPSMVAHLSGQPNLTAQFVVPFLALFVTRLPARPVRNGVILGLLITYQVFLNEEILFLAGLAIGFLVLVYALFDRARARREWRGFLTGAAVALAVAVPLLAYPMYWQFLGPQHYRGLPVAPTEYGADLAAYVRYARESLAGSDAIGRITASPNEDNAGFGGLLLLLVLVLVVWMWRQRLVRALAITATAFGLISLGSRVAVDGDYTSIPGPFAVLRHLPLFDLAVPGRFAMVTAPVIAVVVALGCQRAIDATGVGWRRLSRRNLVLRGVAAAVVAIAVLPMLPTPIPAVNRQPVPRFITSGDWRRYVPAGKYLVTVPLGGYRTPGPLLWQATEGLDYQMPRGYFLGPESDTDPQAIFGAPPRPTSDKLYAVGILPWHPVPYVGGDTPVAGARRGDDLDYSAAQVSDADRANALVDLRYWHAAVLVLPLTQRNHDLLRMVTTELVGFDPVQVDDVWLWDVRALVG